MTERRVSSEKCANCPNRGQVEKLLARATRQNEFAAGCEGSIEVSRGQIVTQVRVRGEASPPQKTWNSLTESRDGVRRYSRTDWTTETVCGREPVEPRDGEVPSGLNGEYIRTRSDGKRFAAFIKGSEDELADHYGTLGVMALLDNLSEMQDAEDEGDEQGAVEAHDKIVQKGFTVAATAGRRGSGKNKSK